MTAGNHGRGRSPERRCRKIDDWPAADRQRWLVELTTLDPLAPGGARARYRDISNRKVEKGWGRYLTWLELAGELNANDDPASRATRGRAAAYVNALETLGNTKLTILARLQELYEAARVMGPGKDWEWIHRIAGTVRARSDGTGNRSQKIVGTDVLFELGLALMRRAKVKPDTTRAAQAFRDGLIIALLALRPLRLRNLAALELHRTLERVGDTWVIVFSGGESTKSGAPIEFPWPETLAPELEEWLGHWRPRMLGLSVQDKAPLDGMLWISCRRTPMSKEALYAQIVMRSRTAFGRPINPHAFRHNAATTLAQADPLNVRLAAPLLTQRNFATTERFYLRANTIAASRTFQDAILHLRHADPDALEPEATLRSEAT